MFPHWVTRPVARHCASPVVGLAVGRRDPRWEWGEDHFFFHSTRVDESPDSGNLKCVRIMKILITPKVLFFSVLKTYKRAKKNFFTLLSKKQNSGF